MTNNSANPGVEVSEAEVSEFWVSKDEIVEDLKTMGVGKGDNLGVALSLKCVGHIVGGPDAFIDALLEAVGPEGTIMMNTYTPYFHISQIESSDPKYIFDYRSTPTWTGIVPETLRKRKNAIRSRHPICSVAAMGPRADYLTEDHDVSSRPYVPFSRLAKIGGKMLYIGLNSRMVAMRHEAQNLAGLMDVVPLEIAIRYIDPDDGETKLFRATNVYACVKNLPALVPAMREMGLITDGKIGAADTILVSAKDALFAMAEMLREDPTPTLCRDVSCIWCRELERRMKLRVRIEDPEIFQSNRAIIGILGVINERRLRGSWAAIKTIGLIKRIL